MASLSLRHVRKVYPARHKAKSKNKAKVARVNDDFVAVKDFSMEIDDGEFIVFVGPSGCGKSTTLRMIAGLEDISSGELYIGDKLMNNVEPRDRDIAMVFQSYALYPHMTSYDNIAFGLRMRKITVPKLDEYGKQVVDIDKQKIKELEKSVKAVTKSIATADKNARKEVLARVASLRDQLKKADDETLKAEIEARIGAIDVEAETASRAEVFKTEANTRLAKLNEDLEYFKNTPVELTVERHYTAAEIDEKVNWAANILGITELLNSKPSDMSGGQRQRIALGRAMVRGPKVFLLDEPLSNLDAKLRTAMRSEIVKLHNQLKTTFIYVTHDQEEAMTMGTRIVVMKDGIIQQIDTPTNLFDFPQNKFVAGFIGTPQMNFFDVKIKKDGNSLLTTFANGETLSFDLAELRTMREEYLDGNEHDVVMGARGESISVSDKGLTITVNIKEVLGSTTHVFVKMGESEYIICLSDRVEFTPGNDIKISFNEKKLHFFDKKTDESILGRDFANKTEVAERKPEAEVNKTEVEEKPKKATPKKATAKKEQAAAVDDGSATLKKKTAKTAVKTKKQ